MFQVDHLAFGGATANTLHLYPQRIGADGASTSLFYYTMQLRLNFEFRAHIHINVLYSLKVMFLLGIVHAANLDILPSMPETISKETVSILDS